MYSKPQIANLAKLETQELVQMALCDRLVFKRVIAEIEKRPPSRAAAEAVINAYRRGNAPPWLAAAILGACRDKTGYATAREILLAASRSLAESYAGVALAKIAGIGALDDLTKIMLNAPDRHSREGAAYGLDALGLPEAAPAILVAALSGKIKTTTGGSILGRTFPDETVVLKLLVLPDKNRVLLATEIMEACLAQFPPNASPNQMSALASRPSLPLLKALERVLSDTDISMRRRKREKICAWLNSKLQSAGFW